MTKCEKHNCWLRLDHCQCDYSPPPEEMKKKLERQVKKLQKNKKAT